MSALPPAGLFPAQPPPELPMKKRKQGVIDKVMERIRARGIWSPYGEAKPKISMYIDRANGKSPLFNKTIAKNQGEAELNQ